MKILLFLISLIYVGCSGAVQTNPLPDNHKLFLPNRELNIKDIDEFQLAKEFDLWLMDYMPEQKIDKKSIWEIGIDRKNTEERR